MSWNLIAACLRLHCCLELCVTRVDVLTAVAGGAGGAGRHVGPGLVQGQRGEVAGRVQRVQRGVDRRRQQRVRQPAPGGHEVEGLECFLRG